MEIDGYLLKNVNNDSLSSDSTIDVDTELLNELTNVYSKISSEVEGNTLDIYGTISALASDLKTFVDNKKKEIVSIIDEIKQEIKNALNEIVNIDESTNADDDLNNSDNTTQVEQDKGPLKKLNLDFFRKNYGNNCFQKNNKWYVRIGNYTYNITDHNLTDNKAKKSIRVNFYAPENCSDLSKLNTVTVFTGKTPVDSGSLVIRPVWNGNRNMVASATKFANTFAKTDLKKQKNIIMGGSKFGSYTLQIAANSGDLYKSVVCINASAIVGGQNAGSGGRLQLKDLSALKKLNGKEIYFVIAKGEPNMYKHAGEDNGWENCPPTQSYLYTGLKLTSKYCPQSQVYMVTNANDPTFNSIRYKNYHYDPNMWKNLGIDASYKGHSYEDIIKDLLSGPLCN